MTVPDLIRQLVQRFDEHRTAYRSGEYNEAQARLEFIDPFFEALGWDVFNKQGYAEAYKDAIHEDAIKVGGATKAPDYAFRIGGTRKFFVEAKKPSVNVKDEITPAYQLRRYAWSAKLPLSILTDFEEFAVYDCRPKPDKTDKASTGRIMMLTYRDYPSHWDEIAGVFSHQAVLKGSFDKYAEAATGKRGTAEVDDTFLAEIERWRELLVHNIALRNPSLSQRDLNYAVQMTIDRLIFLRICEDRSIEFYGQLQSLLNGGETYPRLCQLFRKADERYNSGLFHFLPERDQADIPDMLTPGLLLDDKPLKDILANLYYPDSPYEFSVLPADILGQVYERFLGKVIRLTAGHHAVVEDKPEVKKAGGVFYTPTFIVEYIVKHTLGKLLEGKTPGQVGLGRGTPLRTLDMSCGSGSFLIGAYQYLLDWYLSGYSSEPEKWSRGAAPRLYQVSSPDGALWMLTTAERKRILLDHIYGVDIDPQAVEVTKLSLLLKVLEGESQESIGKQLSMFRQRALPDLASNIKCGNSLIGPDFYTNQPAPQGTLPGFDLEEQYRINAFDWHREFADVFISAGGFDIIIGNPPYIQLSMADYFNKPVNKYLSKIYSSSMGRLNSFGLFIEQGLRNILVKNGLLSYIVPNTILTQEYYQALREQILSKSITNITSYDFPVFENAVVETVVVVVKNVHLDNNIVSIFECDNKEMIYRSHQIPQEVFLKSYRHSFIVKVDDSLVSFKEKLDKEGHILKSLVNINQAIALKYDRSKSLFLRKEADNFKPVLDGRNIQRYYIEWGGYFLAYDISKIHSCKRTDIFEAKEKLFFRRVGERLIATYDNNQYYALNTLVVITLLLTTHYSIKYILGLINSNLLNFYYVKFLKSTKVVFSEIQARQLAQLPIHEINFSDPDDVKHHNHMVALVERMLSLHQQLASANTPNEKTLLQRQIDTTDAQIDALVYELYGLTEEEIKLVEGN